MSAEKAQAPQTAPDPPEDLGPFWDREAERNEVIALLGMKDLRALELRQHLLHVVVGVRPTCDPDELWLWGHLVATQLARPQTEPPPWAAEPADETPLPYSAPFLSTLHGRSPPR